MQIYIMRHGEAQTFSPTDEERPLTPRGEQESKDMAHWLMDEQGIGTLDHVLLSPYLRAQQTWNVCASILPHKKISIEQSITPFGDSAWVGEYIRALVKLENISSLLMVSHLPLVGYLTADFVKGMEPPLFPTSSISCIEFDAHTDQSTFVWLKSPRNL